MGMLDTDEVADVIGLPTYVVDTVIRRDLGNGIASIINCRRMNGLLIPVCEVVISGMHLIGIGKDTSQFALEMYRRQQMAQMTEEIGLRH